MIDLAMIRSRPGTVRNEVEGRRERGRGGGGEGCAPIGCSGDTCHDVSRLMAPPPVWDHTTTLSPK